MWHFGPHWNTRLSSGVSGSDGGSMKMNVLWDVAPCVVEIGRRSKGAWASNIRDHFPKDGGIKHLKLWPVSLFIAVVMEAVRSFEMSVTFYAWRSILEDKSSSEDRMILVFEANLYNARFISPAVLIFNMDSSAKIYFLLLRVEWEIKGDDQKHSQCWLFLEKYGSTLPLWLKKASSSVPSKPGQIKERVITI